MDGHNTSNETLEELGLRPNDPVTLSFYVKVPEDAPGSVYPRITCYKPDGTYYTRTGGKRIGPGEEDFTTFTTIVPSDCNRVAFHIQRTDGLDLTYEGLKHRCCFPFFHFADDGLDLTYEGLKPNQNGERDADFIVWILPMRD